MATTPPAQLLSSSPSPPPTPLHGAKYDDKDSTRTRFSSRLKQKHDTATSELDNTTDFSEKTPKVPQNSLRRAAPVQSPARTPNRKVKSAQRTQIHSPLSPDSDSYDPYPARLRRNNLQPFTSSTTTMSESMLPTPVKTPKKPQIAKSSLTARALFQDTAITEDTVLSPRRARKNKRFNGFSLESFRADDGAVQGVQIFTDSRDNIPEADSALDNPFLDSERRGVSTQHVAGTSKRRKISTTKPKDPQVERAIRDDDGMVYVFRGKKVYRRFDDTGEEEEEIDAEDLGLLRYTPNGSRRIKPMKTLTRKSIKPTRLFQSEEQPQDREIDKEEAVTDIEDSTFDQDPTVESPLSQSKIQLAQAKKTSPRFTSSVKDETDLPAKKKASPFDSWARLKPGSASVSRATRSRKRTASQEPDISH